MRWCFHLGLFCTGWITVVNYMYILHSLYNTLVTWGCFKYDIDSKLGLTWPDKCHLLTGFGDSLFFSLKFGVFYLLINIFCLSYNQPIYPPMFFFFFFTSGPWWGRSLSHLSLRRSLGTPWTGYQSIKGLQHLHSHLWPISLSLPLRPTTKCWCWWKWW